MTKAVTTADPAPPSHTIRRRGPGPRVHRPAVINDAPAAPQPPAVRRRTRGRTTVGARLATAWFAICVLTVLIASDYKFRVRDPNATLGTKIDSAIVLEVGLYGLVLLYLLSRRPTFKVVRTPAPMVAGGVYVALMVISLVHTQHLPVEVIRATEMIIVLMLVIAVVRAGTRIDIHLFLHGFLLLVAASVVVGVVAPMPRFASQQDRFTWLRIHPVTSAVYLAVGLVIAAGYVVVAHDARPGWRWSRTSYVVLGLVMAGGLYATKTRGAVLGAVVGLLVLSWLMTATRRRLELLAVGAIGAVAFVALASGQIVAYISRGESTAQLASLNSRTELWSVAYAYIRERPLNGYGLGASHSLFITSTGLGGAHNAVVNVVTDLGLIGASIWLWMILSTVRRAFTISLHDRGVRGERATLLAVMAVLVVNGVSNGGLGDEANISATLLFVIAGWSCILAADPLARPQPTRRRTAPVAGR